MRIKEVMKAHGITQEELAERMNINRVSVNRLLSDKNDMRMSTLRKFADAIGCRVTELIEEDEEMGNMSFVCPHCGKPIKVTVS